jgi:hypothetical protein
VDFLHLVGRIPNLRLVGGLNPSEKYKSLGLLFPIYGKP